MLQASNLAGKAINITRTSIAHAISYVYTINYNVPHGLACSFTLSKIHEYVFNELQDNLYIDVINNYLNVINFLENFNFKEFMNDFTKGNIIDLNKENLNTTRSSTFLTQLNKEILSKFNS